MRKSRAFAALNVLKTFQNKALCTIHETSLFKFLISGHSDGTLSAGLARASQGSFSLRE